MNLQARFGYVGALATSTLQVSFGNEGAQVQLRSSDSVTKPLNTWVVVKIMVPFWVPNIVRHLLFRVPQQGP